MTDENKSKKEVVKTANSLVFISHDTRDAKLAEAFSALLKSVSAGVLKSFRTSDRKGNQGIEYGVEWYPEIIKNIQEASDVVCLLTKRSVNRPWILFEAGMAKGKLETPILGVALGISLKDASSGPFAQFQNCADDEGSLTKLVFQLVDRIPNSEPDEDTIKFQVDKFKESITKIFKAENTVPETQPLEFSNKENSSAKLFEEIKVMFQDLPSRIENNINPEIRIRKKRHSFHPAMVDEIVHMANNKKTGILFGLSILKEGAPWLYDIGIETLRIIDSDSHPKVRQKAIFQFRDVVDFSTGNPMILELLNSDEDFMLYKKLSYVLIDAIERYIEKITL